MSFTPMEKFASPEYWHEFIDRDKDSDQRKAFDVEIGQANELMSNNVALGLDANVHEVQPSTWMKTFQAISGRMLYGEMLAKVEGMGDEDIETANTYQAGINWEFTQPRGFYNKVGRRQVRKTGEDWITYGMGVYNTYWDSQQRSRENPTGSIINEAIPSKDIYLDSDAESFDEINRISRVKKRLTAEVAMMYPHLDPEKIPNEKGYTYLFDIQFRTPQRVTGKLSTVETRDMMGEDDLLIMNGDRNRFEDIYRKSFKGTKVADSTKAWDALSDDSHIQPMVYSFQFLSKNALHNKKVKNEYLALNKEARYVGRDYSYTLLPFLFQPGTIYPSGAAKFIYGDQVYEGLLLTLYLQMLKRLNNTGLGVNLQRLHGDSDAEKLKNLKLFMEQEGYPLLLKGITDVNMAISQLRQNPPPREMLLAADSMGWRAEDFFQTHGEQVGQTPQAGTPFRSMALAQSAGATIAAHMGNSMKNFITTTHRKTATLLYEYMPASKMIQLTSETGERKSFLIEKKILKRRNPQDIDIVVELDTDTEAQKAQKKQEGYALFELGMSAPQDFLKDIGVRDIERRLGNLRDHKRGQLIVAMEKEHPGLSQMIDETMRSHMQEKGASDGGT